MIDPPPVFHKPVPPFPIDTPLPQKPLLMLDHTIALDSQFGILSFHGVLRLLALFVAAHKNAPLFCPPPSKSRQPGLALIPLPLPSQACIWRGREQRAAAARRPFSSDQKVPAQETKRARVAACFCFVSPPFSLTPPRPHTRFFICKATLCARVERMPFLSLFPRFFPSCGSTNQTRSKHRFPFFPSTQKHGGPALTHSHTHTHARALSFSLVAHTVVCWVHSHTHTHITPWRSPPPHPAAWPAPRSRWRRPCRRTRPRARRRRRLGARTCAP